MSATPPAHPRPRRDADKSDAPPPIPASASERVDIRAARPDLRASIAITGSSSNTGKTWLCERVIEGCREQGLKVLALKVTRTHVNHCPRGNDACGVCDSLDIPWRIIQDRALLDVRKKDTGRYYAAGADRVLWLLVQPSAVAGAVRAVLSEIPPGHVLIAEGNSFADYTAPDRLLMMLSDRYEMKASATTLLSRVHLFSCRPVAIPHFQAFFGAHLAGRSILSPEDVVSRCLADLGLRG